MDIKNIKIKTKEFAIHLHSHGKTLAKNQKERDIVTLLYNDYFTENESENIFVAVNDDDDAIGYIICSTDYKKFKSVLKKRYLPKLWKLSKRNGS